MLAAKEAAQADDRGTPVVVEGDEGDCLFVGPGSLKKGIQCKFVAQWQGNLIAIVDRDWCGENQANVFVEFHSAYLMLYGHEQAYANVRALLLSLGFVWDHETISRVDLCVDLLDVTPAEFFNEDGQRIGRARADHLWRENRVVTGWRIGADGAPIVCRIYDKELESRRDVVKRQLLAHNRWGCENPSKATRVEFQLRSEALRELGVRSFTDLCDKLEALVAYLVYEWLRFGDVVDRENKHQSRSGTSPLWKRVQTAFEAWSGRHRGMVPKRVKNLGQACVKQLAQQAAGCVAKLAAMSGQARDTLESAWEWVNDQVPELAKEFPDRFFEKICGLKRTTPGVYVDLREVPF